jgi:hypothetical protein
MLELVRTGHKLMNAAEEHLRQHWGCSSPAMFLHVLSSNAAACRFYEGLGWRSLQRIAGYYHFQGQDHDAFLFYRHLHDLPPAPHGEDFTLQSCWTCLQSMLYICLG